MFGLYVSSVLIIVRSVFRLIEFTQGDDGYLVRHEVFVYIFDGFLMFLAMMALNTYHPSTVISSGRKRADGRVEDMQLRMRSSA